jgi:hypothetical protein
LPRREEKFHAQPNANANGVNYYFNFRVVVNIFKILNTHFSPSLLPFFGRIKINKNLASAEMKL